MPRALILGPQRRSIVSSIPLITVPSGTKVPSRRCSRRLAAARLDQRFRLSTRWKLVKPVTARRPRMLRAEVTVRRPGARRAPASSTSRFRQVGPVNRASNGASHWPRMTGAAGLVMSVAPDGRHHQATRRRQEGWMPKADALLERIEAFHHAGRGEVVVRKLARGYSLFSARTGAPIADRKSVVQGKSVYPDASRVVK